MSLNYVWLATQIVLTGFCVYRIQRFTRTHKTWELAFCFLLFTLGFAAILNPTEFMSAPVKNIFNILLAFFILFLTLEPELAGIASRIADRFNPNSLTRKKAALREIVQAAAALATTKTGALIAFEKNDSLIPYGESGIEINADIKKELLATLFYKDTPTHDGGLLIREGRVTHCGAVFPLTDRKQMNGLGTRHRAALGLSEKTDAVCLVISEEEGTISIAKDGELLYNVPVKDLEHKLSFALVGTNLFRFYPFHYIKNLSPKLVQENYIQFCKSFSEKIYELTILLFFSSLCLLLAFYRLINFSDFKNPIDLLFAKPAAFGPVCLLLFNLLILLSNRKVRVNGIINDIKVEDRFLFFPPLRRTLLKENLKGVVLKHERSGSNLWSLWLLNKKRKTYLLDRSTASKALSEYARKIKEVLKLDLVN